MRVPARDLLPGVAKQLIQIQHSLALTNDHQKDHGVQHIAKLFLQMATVFSPMRAKDFPHLFDQMGHE